MKKRILVSFIAMAMLIVIAPLGYTADISYDEWSDWSAWQDTPIDPVDNGIMKREVQTQEVLVSYTYGHYCTGNVEGAKYQTNSSNHIDNSVFNENCVYHEIGDFAPDDSRIKASSLGGGKYEYYESGSSSKYLCPSTCYNFYRMRENFKTQYRYREMKLKPVPKNPHSIIATNKIIAINSKPVSLDVKTDGNGKLSYSSSAESVATVSSVGVVTPIAYGTTIITIKAAETSAYKANSKEITVSVVPKKMIIKKAKASGKRTMSIIWKKDKTVSGYQVMLSMKKNFKKYTVSRNFKAKVTKQKITSLKSKIWYVRMRAYKKVKGKKLYGIWSKIKKVKIK
ncbi:MAG: hypothetical protein IJH60_01510 [Eubacterium sp.]|nr:hypothetical protein [Eubacterium sp.]